MRFFPFVDVSLSFHGEWMDLKQNFDWYEIVWMLRIDNQIEWTFGICLSDWISLLIRFMKPKRT